MRRSTLSVWLGTALLIMTCASRSWAEQSATGPGTLDRAIAAYEDLHIEDALRLLEQAERIGDLDDSQRARLLLYRGLGRASLGQQDASTEAFRQALAIDPELELPEHTSPVVVEQFEGLRAEARAAVQVTEPVVPDQPEDPAVEPPPVTPEPEPPPPRRYLMSWVFTGLTGATFVGGATSLVLALVTRSQAQGEARPQDEADDLLDTYRLEARLAFSLLGATAALAVATLIAFLGERPRQEPSRAPTVALTPAPGGLVLAGTFGR